MSEGSEAMRDAQARRTLWNEMYWRGLTGCVEDVPSPYTLSQSAGVDAGLIDGEISIRVLGTPEEPCTSFARHARLSMTEESERKSVDHPREYGRTSGDVSGQRAISKMPYTTGYSGRAIVHES